MRIYWLAAASRRGCLQGCACGGGACAGKWRRGSRCRHLMQHAATGETICQLAAQGRRTRKAMQVVNADARDGHACGVAAVAYIRNQTVGTVKLKDRLVQIVRINVVAGFTGSGWERATADMIQYAVLEGAGRICLRNATVNPEYQAPADN